MPEPTLEFFQPRPLPPVGQKLDQRRGKMFRDTCPPLQSRRCSFSILTRARKTLVAATYGRGIWNFALVTSPHFSILLTASPDVTPVNQNVTWNGTLRALDGYTGSVTLSSGRCSCDLRYRAIPDDADHRRRSIFGDFGQCNHRKFRFRDSGDGRDTDQCHASRNSYRDSSAAEFSIAVTATPNTTAADENVNWNGTLTSANGYTGSVALSCSAGAPGTCEISPATVTPSPGGSPFVVTVGSATAGTFPLRHKPPTAY